MEQFVNGQSTTLDGAVNASTTSITVVNGNVFPASGNFRIKIDSEIIKVTSRTGDVLTVVRGTESTTGASHSNGAGVQGVITADTLNEFRKDNISSDSYAQIITPTVAGRIFLPNDSLYFVRDNGSNLSHFGPISKMTLPDDSAFSWVNQGSATVNSTNGVVHLNAPLGAGANLRIRKKSQPTTPYTIRAFLSFARQDANFNSAGIGLRESGTGKLETVHFIRSTTSLVEANKWNSATSYNSTRATRNVDRMLPAPQWLQIANDNTTITLSYSVDGLYFYEIASFAKANFFTTGPDEVFWFASSDNASYKITATLHSWEQF